MTIAEQIIYLNERGVKLSFIPDKENNSITTIELMQRKKGSEYQLKGQVVHELLKVSNDEGLNIILDKLICQFRNEI